MGSKHFIFAVLIGVSMLLAAPVAIGGNTVQDIIVFDNDEGKVTFDHRKHFDGYFNEYPELYESSCGECHHDKDNNKLVDLKEGDAVQKCIECHKKPGYIKGKEARSLSKEQKREYVANAFHDNCKGCHKDYNKARKLKRTDEGYAPNSCKACHVK